MAMRGEETKTTINGVRNGATEYSSLNTKSDRLPVTKRAEDRRCEIHKTGRLWSASTVSVSPRCRQKAPQSRSTNGATSTLWPSLLIGQRDITMMILESSLTEFQIRRNGTH